MTHARIAHAGNWFSGGLVIPSTVDPAPIYDGVAPTNSLLFERWKPAGIAGRWTYGPETSVAADYCVVAGHELGYRNAAIRVLAAPADGPGYENLLPESVEFSGWSLTRTLLSEVTALSPTGSSRVKKVSENGTGNQVFGMEAPITAERTYTISAYLRADGRRYGEMRFVTDAGFVDLTAFDLVAGTADGGRIEDAGNGWFRVWVTGETQPGATFIDRKMFYIADPFGNVNYTGDGVSGFQIWRPQINGGPSPKEAFPTFGNAVTFSRLAPVTDWIRPKDNAPLFFIFDEVPNANALAIEVDGNAASIGFIRFGAALQMEQRSRYPGRTPFDLARQTVTTGNASVRGEFLSRVTLRAGQDLEFTWSHLSEGFTQTEIKAFLDAIEDDLFVIADRPATHPEDVAICWTAGQRPRPVASGAEDLHDLSLKAQGYLEYG
ncbi:phage head spike fiber domain-containing protein [Roseovarius sp. C03]|uniref:phage head spike fiber domain-containing protein n=1 Tax=Roseovarius sp. C03 TaxID=3449222 RepID=UPI003EDC8B8D